jgi:hypothetical protein
LWGATVAAAPVRHEWTFDDETQPQAWPHGCTATPADGILKGEITEADPGVWLWLPEVAMPAPAKLTLRLRTSETMVGRGEVHTKTRERPDIGMHSLVRFPLAHDGQWHEISVPLPATGTIQQLRLAVGYRPGTFELDWVRLESDPYPVEVLRLREAIPEHLAIQDGVLRLLLRPREHHLSIVDQRTGREWLGDASGCKALLVGAKTTSADTMLLDFYDHSTRTRFACTVSLPEPGALAFELTTQAPEIPFFALSQFPPMLTSELDAGRLIFCDRSAGVYAPQTDAAYAGRLLCVYGNTSTTNLPLVGVVDCARGDGMMALVETPCDALFSLTVDGKQRAWPQVHWEESLDTFRYPRRLSYRFVPSGGYVALARVYREYAARQGHVVPFREKALRRPLVARLKGAPILWGGRDPWRFVQEARVEGMLAGVLANAQHGLWDEGSLRQLNALGYLTAPYDNLADALDGPTGQGRDPEAETALHSRPGLGPQAGWQDELNRHFIRSSAFGLRALSAYLPADLERYGYNARFVDVTLAIQLMEDWHPQHTFDRRQDMGFRRECFRLLNDLGLVVGAEHGNDWGIEWVDWTEGAIGGPFWWDRARPEGWDPGRLKRAVAREDYTDKYLRFGLGFDTRVPFWQLVYHDCVVSTWYWGDGPDFHFDAAADVAETKDLQTLLFGGVPILWRGDEGYGWERNRERFLQSYRDTCLFHREVAFARLTCHEFLSPDMALQRTCFDSGHTAVVSFADGPREYVAENGAAVTLAPRGYCVTGPGFRQTKLWLDGATAKSLEADGYVVYDAPGQQRLGAVERGGRFVAFRVSPTRWQLALEPGTSSRFRVAALTGWDVTRPYALVELDGLGAERRVRQTGAAGDDLTIAATPGARFYALEADPDPTVVTVYPTGGAIEEGETMVLSLPTSQATIRYTLDGSEPTAASTPYTGPCTLDRSAVITARAFSAAQPIGPTTTRALRLLATLFHSPRLRGGDDPQRVDIPVAGMAQLHLRVGDGGDHCWSDWADWGDASFVRADGTPVYLSDLTPVSAKQTYHALAGDGNPPDRHPIRIHGRQFSKGLCCFSEAAIVYDIPADAQRFAAWVGVDDRGNPGPDGPEVLRGTVTFSVAVMRPWAADAPAKVALTPVAFEPGSEGAQQLPPIAFEMRAPWLDGPVRLRIPEVLVSSLGCHFVDHLLSGEGALRPLNPMAEYPVWKRDPITGSLRYDKLLPEGLEFGCTATPGPDEVALEFRVTNRTPQPISWASGNLCLQCGGAPCLAAKWDLDRLLVLLDGKLEPLSVTTPTPADRGTQFPWLHLLSRRGLLLHRGPRDLGTSWFVDQVPDSDNLMAVISADRRHYVGYTWDLQPDVLMCNAGHPCLHTGTAPSPVVASGCTHTWSGKVYFVAAEPETLADRCRRDHAAWDRGHSARR